MGKTEVVVIIDNMQKNILITGEPKSGKSTLLRTIIAGVPQKVGFVTKEILNGGERTGFEAETHLGSKFKIADVNFETPYKVSKYFVDVGNLEAALPEVEVFGRSDILYLDEIGQMQLFSDKFKELALKYLNSPNTCIATLSAVHADDFIESIRGREDVILIELTPENRVEKEELLGSMIGSEKRII